MERVKLLDPWCLSPYCHNRVTIGVVCKQCFTKLSKYTRWELNAAVFSLVLPIHVKKRIIKKVYDRLSESGKRGMRKRARLLMLTVNKLYVGEGERWIA